MTVTERKERQKALREQLFLDKAAELIAKEGILQLQMAPLAKACDYATGTLYQHFSSKEDLLLALVGRNSNDQLQLFRGIANLAISSREKLVALCVADHMGRQQHPSHSRLEQYVFTEAVWQNASLSRREMLLANSKPLAELVSRIVQQAIDDAELPVGSNADDLSVASWALCLGRTTLEQTEGLLAAFSGKQDPLQRYRHIHMLLNGMQWQPIVDPAESAFIAAQVSRLQSLVAALFNHSAVEI